MPKGQYERKPREADIERQQEHDLLRNALLRIEAIERRQAQMDEAFAKGYMPSPGGLIGGSRGP